MKRIHIGIAILALALTGVYACTGAEENNTTEAPSENVQAATLPAFDVVDMNGNRINLESLRGKKVFVNLWATWCPPCRREIPSIEKLYQDVDKEKNAFILLSLDQDIEDAKRFAADHKLAVPVYYPAGQLPSLFAVETIPSTFIFDETGRLVKDIRGMEDFYTNDYRQLFQ